MQATKMVADMLVIITRRMEHPSCELAALRLLLSIQCSLSLLLTRHIFRLVSSSLSFSSSHLVKMYLMVDIKKYCNAHKGNMMFKRAFPHP